MANKKRLEIIRETLKDDKKVVVADLAIQFKVTEETIRRDLDKLEREGVAVRTYGGAIYNQDNPNVGVFYRKRALVNPERKRLIAKNAYPLVREYSSIGFDSSTTAMELLRLLVDDEGKTVITYSEAAIQELSQSSLKIISTGGILNKNTLSYHGPIAISTANQYRLDAFIMSCRGMTLDSGIYDTDELEAEVKRQFIANSKQVILLADQSKFSATGFVRVQSLEHVHYLVTDRKPSQEWLDGLSKLDIKVIY